MVVKDGGEVYISTFVGMIAPFGTATVPAGWLACNGTMVSKTTYSALYAVLGANRWGSDTTDNFPLPDLEGAFLRGTGTHASQTMANSSLYAGPSVGSFEGDQFQGHQHQVTLNGQDVGETGISGSGFSAINEADNDFSGHRYKATTIQTLDDGSPREGDETRPFNAGVKYCIKF